MGERVSLQQPSYKYNNKVKIVPWAKEADLSALIEVESSKLQEEYRKTLQRHEEFEAEVLEALASSGSEEEKKNLEWKLSRSRTIVEMAEMNWRTSTLKASMELQERGNAIKEKEVALRERDNMLKDKENSMLKDRIELLNKETGVSGSILKSSANQHITRSNALVDESQFATTFIQIQ